MNPEPLIDIDVTDHGSLIGFAVLTTTARIWVDDNVEANAWLGNTFFVERRFAEALTDGMIDAGLLVS